MNIFLPIVFSFFTAWGFMPDLPTSCDGLPEYYAAWNASQTAVILCTDDAYGDFTFDEDGSAVWTSHDDATGLDMSTAACVAPQMGCAD